MHTVKWTHRFKTRAFFLMGPNVGPDGNIYAIAVNGSGIVSLTPAGKLRWSTPEPYRRPIARDRELVFGPGPKGLQMYFHANRHLARVDTSSGKLFAMSGSTESAHGQPAVGPNGNVYASVMRDLMSFKPDGTRNWTYGYVPRNNMSAPTVDAKGTTYVVRNTSYLHALRQSDGKSMWMHTDFSGLRFPTVSPANRLILMAGTTRAWKHFMRAVSLAGALMWQVNLPQDSRGRVFPMSKPRFTPDGKTVYFGTMQDNVTCYLYAIDTSAQKRAEVWTWGLGCPGISRKTPAIGFTGRPVLGLGMSVDLTNARASANAAHVLGLQQTRVSFKWLGAPGCTAYAHPDLIIPLKTDSLGRATSPLRIPKLTVLAGLRLFHQFVVADPVNRLGVVSTEGGGSVLGFQ